MKTNSPQITLTLKVKNQWINKKIKKIPNNIETSHSMNNINQINITTKNLEILGINNIIENCPLNIY